MYRRIRELREDRDWSQANVAKELNCSQQVYSNYELGQRDIPQRCSSSWQSCTTPAWTIFWD